MSRNGWVAGAVEKDPRKIYVLDRYLYLLFLPNLVGKMLLI